MTDDEMVGWHHQLNGHESEQGRWWGTGKPGVLQRWIAKSRTQLSHQTTKHKQPQNYLREHSLGSKHIICCRKGQLWKFIIRRKLRTIFNWGVTEELLNSHPTAPQARTTKPRWEFTEPANVDLLWAGGRNSAFGRLAWLPGVAFPVSGQRCHSN